MRHVLVIANQTAVGSHLTSRVQELREIDPDLDVFVLVPATPMAKPRNAGIGSAAHDHDGFERARRQLASAIAGFEALGIPAEGRVGDPDPMRAAHAIMGAHNFGLVLMSTLPTGASRWINMDLPHRLARRYKVAVEHIVGEAQELPTREPGPVKVLLVEDQPADAELAREAFELLSADVTMKLARHGHEALAYIRTLGVNAFDLILLDLNMPIMDGHELLAALGEEFDLAELNVVILTTSTNVTDRERAHDLGASAYVVKDHDFDAFCSMLDSLVSEAMPV